MGIPCYFLFRNALGINNAAVLMVLMMLPAFLFAMYEKDGMHLEDVLMHVIRVKFYPGHLSENMKLKTIMNRIQMEKIRKR